MSDEILVEETEEGRPPRGWDFFLTIFLLFLLLVMTVVFLVAGLGFGVRTLTCADSAERCNYDVISIGSLIVIIGTPLVALAGIVVSVVWIARRKISFIIPLIAVLASAGLFILGGWLVDLAVPA